MSDDYLKRFEGIQNRLKENTSEFKKEAERKQEAERKRKDRIHFIKKSREFYKEGSKAGRDEVARGGLSGIPFSMDHVGWKNQLLARGYAKKNLAHAEKTGDLDFLSKAIFGYKRGFGYDYGAKIKYPNSPPGYGLEKRKGIPSSIKSKVLNALEKYSSLPESKPLSSSEVREIQSFLEIPSRKDLASKVTAIMAIAGLVGGLFFLSPNLTGNAVGSLTNVTSNYTGAILFILGLVGVYLSARN